MGSSTSPRFNGTTGSQPLTTACITCCWHLIWGTKSSRPYLGTHFGNSAHLWWPCAAALPHLLPIGWPNKARWLLRNARKTGGLAPLPNHHAPQYTGESWPGLWYKTLASGSEAGNNFAWCSTPKPLMLLQLLSLPSLFLKFHNLDMPSSRHTSLPALCPPAKPSNAVVNYNYWAQINPLNVRKPKPRPKHQEQRCKK